jgi:hypothetical protein
MIDSPLRHFAADGETENSFFDMRFGKFRR